MSKVVMCDECERIVKASDAVAASKMFTSRGQIVKGFVHVCPACMQEFDLVHDAAGWTLVTKHPAQQFSRVGDGKAVRDGK